MFGVFTILTFNITGIYFDYIPWFTAFTTKISLFKNYGLAAFGIIEPWEKITTKKQEKKLYLLERINY